MLRKEGLTMTLSHRLKTFLVLAISVFSLTTAVTVAHAPDADAKSRILTSRTVKQFIASYPDVKTIAGKHAARKELTDGDAKGRLAAVIEAVSDEAVGREIDGAVRAHGFSDAGQWASIGESIARAYAHIKTGGGGVTGKAERKLEKAIAKIEKNDILNEKQKAKMISALREGVGAVLEPPPPENVAAVEPMIGEIDAMMN
jgi:hypothetical protein